MSEEEKEQRRQAMWRAMKAEARRKELRRWERDEKEGKVDPYGRNKRSNEKN